MTLVSVILPTRNRVAFLEEALGSVLSQTHQNLECLVVDGGSTDGTQAYLDTVGDERVQVIRHEQPRGVSAARNAGLEATSGEYVVFLDDDDLLYDHAIETLLETLRGQSPNCAGVYSACRVEEQSGDSYTLPVTAGVTESYLGTNIAPSGTLLRANVIEEIGGFDEAFPACEDADFFVRVFSSYVMVGLEDPIYERREHDDHLSMDEEAMLQGHLRLLDKHGEHVSPQSRADMLSRVAHNHARLGRVRSARSYLRSAIRTYPWNLQDYYFYSLLLFGSASYDLGYRVASGLYYALNPRA